ncbi:hypothetical protein BH10PAT1_BH10PAT1_3050 [soil metagenome]
MKKYYFVLLLCLIHIFILSRLQFTAWPEMTSFPYLINHGFITYKDMVHAYPPLLINILAVLYKIFGYNVWILKIFGWISFLINDVLVFAILTKLIKKNNLAIVGVFVYIILQTLLDGNMIWPDLIIIPSLLSGFLFILNKKYFIAGILFALGFLTKQTVVFYIVISFIYIFIEEKRKIVNFICGGLLIGLPFLISLIQQKSLIDFLNWTIIYPSRYWTKFPGYVQLTPTLRENIILLILVLPLAILVFKSSLKIFKDKYFLILFSFLIAGILGIYPRFSFFHLQAGIAFFVILICYLISKTKFNYYYLLLIPFLILIINFRSLQFGGNRFWDNDLVLGKIIQNETPDGKPIYLIGLNSDLYAFSNRLPNKPWLDNFGWYLEIEGVQESVIKSFEENPPSIVFWTTPETGNWYDIGVYQPKLITNYILNNYIKTKEIQKGVWEWKRK